MNLFERHKNKKFWDWFAKNSESYLNFENNQDALFDELHARLKKVSKFACFEFSPKKNGKRDFIISTDGIAAGAQAVQDLVEDAPKFDKWTIIAFRPRIGVGRIEMDGVVLDASAIAYRYAFNEGNRIDLQLHIKGYEEGRRREYIGATFVLLDALLGEYDVMTKVGALEFCDLRVGAKKQLHPLSTLPKLIDSRRGNPVL